MPHTRTFRSSSFIIYRTTMLNPTMRPVHHIHPALTAHSNSDTRFFDWLSYLTKNAFKHGCRSSYCAWMGQKREAQKNQYKFNTGVNNYA